LHGPPGLHTEVGPGATVAHNCVVHGAILEEECLVANGAVVLDGARIGDHALVAAGSLVPANFVVPPKMLAAGSPVALKRPVTGSPAEFWVNANPGAYAELATRHRAGMRWLRD
jgi:carbonic anhydrase/acetyltransferase-like protein (isoleucine patch superfamily)